MYSVAVNSHAHIRAQDSDAQSKIAFTLEFNTFTFVIFPTTLDFFFSLTKLFSVWSQHLHQ